MQCIYCIAVFFYFFGDVMRYKCTTCGKHFYVNSHIENEFNRTVSNLNAIIQEKLYLNHWISCLWHVIEQCHKKHCSDACIIYC